MKTRYGELPIKEKNGRARLVRSMAHSETQGRLSYPQGKSQLASESDRATIRSAPPYRSQLERAYAQHLGILQAAGEIEGYWYERMNFRLPGERNFYKADFVVKRILRRFGVVGSCIEIHEVKGWSKNRREGITKLKTAAGLNPWARFVLVTWRRGRWNSHHVEA